MSYQVSSEEVSALLTEAEASRRLARTLRDLQAGIDLEAYALALETQAALLAQAKPRPRMTSVPQGLGLRLLQGLYLGRA